MASEPDSRDGFFAQLSEQIQLDLRSAQGFTLHHIFGQDRSDSASMAELFGLAIPDADDSVSTQRLLEKLHTEATLLRQSLPASAIPSLVEHPTMNRLMSAVAFVKELQDNGSASLLRRGLGERRKIDVVSQQSIDYAADLLMKLQQPLAQDQTAHSVQAQPSAGSIAGRV